MIYVSIYVPFKRIGFSRFRFDNPMTIRERPDPLLPSPELFADENRNPYDPPALIRHSVWGARQIQFRNLIIFAP